MTLLSAFLILAPEAALGKTFANCAEIRKSYPNGVATGAKAIGKESAYPAISKLIYQANSKMDLDGDGHICEVNEVRGQTNIFEVTNWVDPEWWAKENRAPDRPGRLELTTPEIVNCQIPMAEGYWACVFGFDKNLVDEARNTGVTVTGFATEGNWDDPNGRFVSLDKAHIPVLSRSWFKEVSVIRKDPFSTFMYSGQSTGRPLVVFTRTSMTIEITAKPYLNNPDLAYTRPGHTIEFIVPDSSFLSKMKVHEAAAQKFIKSQSSKGGAPSSNNSGSSAGKFTSTPQQGAACDWSKHGNKLVKKGSDYFLCDGGVWKWWKSAASGGGSGSDSKPDVKPGQPCSPLGARVESKSNGTVVCTAVKVGRLAVLTWRRVN
jgi:hypothetical protein